MSRNTPIIVDEQYKISLRTIINCSESCYQSVTNGQTTSFNICTQNHELFFGEILNSTIYLSENGKIAEHFWYEIPKRFPYIVLDEFIIMPNHLHGILVIDKMDGNVRGVETDRGVRNDRRDAINRVSTMPPNTLMAITNNPTPPDDITENKIHVKQQSITNYPMVQRLRDI